MSEKAHRVEAVDPRIPTCLTRCCREWIAPFGYRGGTCGICGEHPRFIRVLPESEWVTPHPPIRPEPAA